VTIRLFAVAIFTVCACAQTASIQGQVKYSNGAVAKDVIVQIDREDHKGAARSFKTNKHGQYSCTGLPEASYHLSLIVGEHVVDTVDHVQTHLGKPTSINLVIKIP
jgi:hypothetical protein